MICNDEDTDGRARVTTDEERVLSEDFIIISQIRYLNILSRLLFEICSIVHSAVTAIYDTCSLLSLPGLTSSTRQILGLHNRIVTW